MESAPYYKSPETKNEPSYFAPESLSNDDKTWAMLAHLAAPIAMVLGITYILGPLVIYLIKKDDSPFVEDQAKEALNFQIAVLIVSVISVITCIGPFIVFVAAIIYSVIAALEANKGIAYRYPYTFRLIH